MSPLQVQGNTSTITGGTRAGNNLFHSFRQFSVSTGGTAYFNNTLDIQNIITRVTGGEMSRIDGLLRANGTANLFLINPNRIIFSPNARLSIGGSFIGSTASNITFQDGTSFNATTSHFTPLLTISVPIGLSFASKPGSIINQSQAANSSSQVVGLQVQPGKTLALIGGDVALQGGSLTAPEGRIELGSVLGPSLVRLIPVNKGWALGYEGVQNFGNIQISHGSTVNTNGKSSGDIQVQGSRVILQNGAILEAINLGSEPGGTIGVNAKESFEINGEKIGVEAFTNELLGLTTGQISFLTLSNGIFNLSFGSGTAGNIVIDAPKIIFHNNVFVSSATRGLGKGGDITVNSQLLEMSTSDLSTGTFANGNAGNLTINTRQMIVSDGAEVFSGNSSSGLGRGGDLTISAVNLELSNRHLQNSNVLCYKGIKIIF